MTASAVCDFCGKDCRIRKNRVAIWDDCRRAMLLAVLERCLGGVVQGWRQSRARDRKQKEGVVALTGIEPVFEP